MNLDQPVKLNFIPQSQYFKDTERAYTKDSIHEVPEESWVNFDRDQLQFGLVEVPIWIRSSIITFGQMRRNLLLDVHGVIDNIDLYVASSDGKSTHLQFGKGSKPTHTHTPESNFSSLGQKADTDHVVIDFKPHHRYELLLKINSSNAVIGSLRIVEFDQLAGENKLRSNAILGYLFLIFLVLFYNLLIFMSTGDKAFIYHMVYVLSITGYLLNSYSFIEAWF